MERLLEEGNKILLESKESKNAARRGETTDSVDFAFHRTRLLLVFTFIYFNSILFGLPITIYPCQNLHRLLTTHTPCHIVYAMKQGIIIAVGLC